MFLWAKYNTSTAIRFPLVKRGVVDLAATADFTPSTGDTKISKDGGNFANTTNNPSATGGTGSVGWTLTLTATELSCAEANVQIVDSATKAVEDQWLTVYTYGNASAKIQADLSDAVRLGLTALPNANAEASGGLYTRGTGAGQINQTVNGLANSNLIDIAGSAVSTSSAQLGVNVVQIGASATAATNLAAIYAAWETGTAQAGGASTITLRSGAVASNDYYKDQAIFILSGTGAGQTNRISSYVGATKVATVETAWVTQPDNTSAYLVIGRIG